MDWFIDRGRTERKDRKREKTGGDRGEKKKEEEEITIWIDG